MKKMKKLFAVLLALAMVMGMTITSFADPGDGTTEQPPTVGSPKATINGVEQEEGKKITVKAYRIIKYNSNGYYEEVFTSNVNISSNPTDGSKPQLTPNAEYIQDLYYNHMNELKALDVKDSTEVVTFNKQSDGTYTYDDLGLGTWLVVVNGSEKYMYNPAIISVNQTSDGKDYGILNLNTNTWNNTTETYLKKDEPKITKTAEAVTGSGADNEVIGTQYGDILKFTVTADIPAYTADKKNITYKITDTLKGLKIVKDTEHPITVKVGGTELTTTSTGVNVGIYDKFNTAIVNDAESFEVTELGDTFLTKHSSEQIVIVYYAKVTSTVKINVDKLNNKAKLEYSNNTNIGEETTSKETETKHYTFGIDTVVKAWSGGESTNKTGEFIKIDDQGNIQYTETPGEVVKKDGKPKFLDKAKFKLFIGKPTKNSESGVYEGTVFTDKTNKSEFTTEGGRLEIIGLDDGVEYYLVETVAPKGYTLNDTPVKVYIDAKYDTDPKTGIADVLKSYTVIIGEGDQAANTYYGYSYDKEETTFIKNNEGSPSNPFGFKNTQLTNLPSTGGIGTTIFTIGGCAIMIIAAGLFFASRRKSAK